MKGVDSKESMKAEGKGKFDKGEQQEVEKESEGPERRDCWT